MFLLIDQLSEVPVCRTLVLRVFSQIVNAAFGRAESLSWQDRLRVIHDVEVLLNRAVLIITKVKEVIGFIHALVRVATRSRWLHEDSGLRVTLVRIMVAQLSTSDGSVRC